MEKGECDAHWRWFLVPAYVARIATTQSRTHGSAADVVTRRAITPELQPTAKCNVALDTAKSDSCQIQYATPDFGEPNLAALLSAIQITYTIYGQYVPIFVQDAPRLKVESFS